MDSQGQNYGHEAMDDDPEKGRIDLTRELKKETILSRWTMGLKGLITHKGLFFPQVSDYYYKNILGDFFLCY